MRRRDLLGVIAAGLSGGCVEGYGSASNEPTSTRTSVHSPTAAPTPGTSRPPSTPEPTSTPDSAPSVEADTQPATETPQPTEASPHIEAAVARLDAAVTAYVEQAATDDATILDVTAAVDDFSAGAVHVETNRAAEVLQRARTATNGDTARPVEELQAARAFLVYAAAAQDNLGNGYPKLRRAVAAVEADRYGSAEAAVGTAKVNTRAAARFVETLRARSDRASLRWLTALTPQDYDAKLDQFDAEIAAFDALQTAIIQLLNARIAYEQELDEYGDRDSTYSSFDGLGFADARRTLAAAPRPASIGDALDALECRSRTYAEASAAFQRAIEARQDGNDRRGNEHEAAGYAALDTLDEC